MSALATHVSGLVAYLPSRYQEQEPRTRTGDLVVQPEDQIRTELPLVLWQIAASGVRLRAASPVTVRIRSEGKFVFTENETLRVFAHGETLDEALEQFQDHVVHFFESYSKLSNDQVIGEGARLKQVFEASFQRG